MEPKPVQYHKPPAYPTRRELLAGAASFVLAGLTGDSLILAASEDGKVVVAPIFEHGEGRGVTGCVVVSPPAFLSEEESLQIVGEELAKSGVKLASGTVLKNLKIAPRHQQQFENDEKSRKIVVDEEEAAPLRVTGMDEKRSIAVEFVSRKNYKRLGGVDSHEAKIVYRNENELGYMSSTVSDYDFKDAAKHVAAEIRGKGRQRLYVGVFYDPITYEKRTRKEQPPKTPKGSKSPKANAHVEAMGKSKELLRQQVQDFVAWLKKQKAIE
jgi:hypothetical protein